MTIFKYNLLVLSRNKTTIFMMIIFSIFIIFILEKLCFRDRTQLAVFYWKNKGIAI